MQSTVGTKRCPKCGEENQAIAAVCKNCGRDLGALTATSVPAKPKPQAAPSWAQQMFILGFTSIAYVIYSLVQGHMWSFTYVILAIGIICLSVGIVLQIRGSKPK